MLEQQLLVQLLQLLDPHQVEHKRRMEFSC
jgi:hypothetical protein